MCAATSSPRAFCATGSCSSTVWPATTPATAPSPVSDLIVVSNPGPVTYDRDESVARGGRRGNRGPVPSDGDASGARVDRRGAGGLVTALRGLQDVTWIASATTDEDRVVAGEGGNLVAHDPEAYRLFYEVVANPMLWFIQHSLWNAPTRPVVDAEFHRAWRDGYEAVNRAFADKVVACVDNRPGATVFFHDYHLYLAPRYVRELRPDARLAHFVHIPWPADWSILPTAMRAQVHDGLLANDVVGFHTERWARNFEASCAEVSGGCGTTLVTHHAISIDVAEFES